MMLAEAQRAFARLALELDHADARALVDRFGSDPQVTGEEVAMLEGLPPDRLELYQALIRGSLWGIQEKAYERVHGLLGAEFGRLCRAYLRDCAPCHWDLNATTLELPTWLRDTWLPAHPERAAWLWELADYERLEMLVFLSEDAPVGEASLHRPQIEASMQLQSFQYDIAGWIRRHEERSNGPLEGAPEATPVITAIYRDPETLRCRFLNINALTAFVLQGWMEGASSPELAEALAPQLQVDAASCLAQIEALSRSLAASRAVRLE